MWTAAYSASWGQRDTLRCSLKTLETRLMTNFYEETFEKVCYQV